MDPLKGKSRERAQKLALECVAAAGDILRIGTANLSTDNARLFRDLVREGAYLDFVISNILGKDPHVRVLLVDVQGAQREMFRVQLR
jgi:hypothetical protein